MNWEYLGVIGLPFVAAWAVFAIRERFISWRHKKADRQKVRELRAFHRENNK